MATAPLKAAICNEKMRLTDELLEAVHALTSLQEAQTAHLVKEGESLPRIETALQAARIRWDTAKLKYSNHVRLHRC